VHEGARSPGLEPPERLPEMVVRDVVVNANDSHWLSHPERTLEGYPVLCGLERTARSLRTRQNLLLGADLARRGDVTPQDLLDAVFDNASLTFVLLRDAVVERCRAAGSVDVGDERVDLTAAADVLAGWDGTATLDAVGVVLWRELICRFDDAAWKGAGPLFAVDFDPEDPVSTPHTLAPAPDGGPDPVLVGVAMALQALERAGVAPDARLGDVQWAMRGEQRVPVHGGGEAEGMLNVLAPVGALASSTVEPPQESNPLLAGHERTGLADGGYQVTYGTSFLMVTEMTPDGPDAVGLLAYGQSGDPSSPHHVDGTRAYAEGRVRPLRFREDQIEADPTLRRLVVGPAEE